MPLKININHPCKECILRSICNKDCNNLHKYITAVYVKISEHLEIEYSLPYDPPKRVKQLKEYLLNKYINEWRVKPIIKG
jgi:hypothetical protein